MDGLKKRRLSYADRTPWVWLKRGASSAFDHTVFSA